MGEISFLVVYLGLTDLRQGFGSYLNVQYEHSLTFYVVSDLKITKTKANLQKIIKVAQKRAKSEV